MDDPTPAAGTPSPRHAAHHALLFGARRVPRRWWWIAAGAVLLAASAAIAGLSLGVVDWAAIMRRIAALRPVPLVLAMATLPLLGFPILPVYLVAGARFGPFGGGAIVALVTVAHLVGASVIARTVLRRPIQRVLRRWHAHLPDIPPDEAAAVTLIAALVPGLPYVVRNYLLAVMGLPLRTYLWICLPIYVARSYVSVLVGNLGHDPNRQQLLLLGGIELAKAAVCAAVIAWLRWHHRRVHGASGFGGSAPPNA